MLTTLRKITRSPDMLGETPVWDWRRGRLFWVDGVGRRVNLWTPDTDSLSHVAVPEKIGCLGLMRHSEEELVVALEKGVWRLSLTDGSLSPLFLLPEDEAADVRFNDGKTDPFGNFLVGTITTQGPPKGRLYRISPDGKARVLRDGIAIPNALCFSPDGTRVYFADSVEGYIGQFAYGPDVTELGAALQRLETRALGSLPDGSCTDSEGNHWATLVQCGQLAKFSPAGELLAVWDTPVDTPSCLCFGGEDLDTLFLTSIKDTGTGRVVSAHADGGHLFALEARGSRGLKEHLFG